MRSEMKAVINDYNRRLRALSTLLYEIDPFIMGASVSAPDDEYDSIAARLLPLLSRAETIEDCRRVLESGGISSETLNEAVWDFIKMS